MMCQTNVLPHLGPFAPLFLPFPFNNSRLHANGFMNLSHQE